MNFEFAFTMSFTGNVGEVRKVALRRARLVDDGLTSDDIEVNVKMIGPIHGPVSTRMQVDIEVTVSFWAGM